jgi:hypothetical protein
MRKLNLLNLSGQEKPARRAARCCGTCLTRQIEGRLKSAILDLKTGQGLDPASTCSAGMTNQKNGDRLVQLSEREGFTLPATNSGHLWRVPMG